MTPNASTESAPAWAVAYVRISKAKEADGTIGTAGVESQQRAVRKLSRQLGWKIGHVITENDTSAYKRRRVTLPGGRTGLRVIRPGFREMLDLLESGECDGLLAVDLDRACRDPRDLEDLIDVVESRTPRIPVESVSGSLRLANDADVTMARIMVAVANKSSRDTARRVAAQREDAAGKGQHTGRIRPFGYDRDPDSPGALRLHPGEAAEIRNAAAVILAGGTLHGLLRDFRARDVPTVSGAEWTIQTIKDVLIRPSTAGHAVYHGEIVAEGQWEAILDAETYNAVCAILSDPARRTSPGNAPRWLGSLIYRCGACEALGIEQTTRVGGRASRPAYVCRNPDRNHLRRTALLVDEMVERYLIKVLSRPDAAALFRRPETNGAADVHALLAEAGGLRERLDGQARMHALGEITLREYRAGREVIAGRLDAVERKVSAAATTSPLARIAGRADAAGVWAALPLDRKRAILREVATVTLVSGRKGGKRPGGGYFDAESVRIDPVRPVR